jgi:hypothetical protein
LGPDLVAVIDRCSDRAARGTAIRLERAHFGRQTRSEMRAPTPANNTAHRHLVSDLQE